MWILRVMWNEYMIIMNRNYNSLNVIKYVILEENTNFIGVHNKMQIYGVSIDDECTYKTIRNIWPNWVLNHLFLYLVTKLTNFVVALNTINTIFIILIPKYFFKI